jgi:hypothetical protein
LVEVTVKILPYATAVVNLPVTGGTNEDQIGWLSAGQFLNQVFKSRRLDLDWRGNLVKIDLRLDQLALHNIARRDRPIMPQERDKAVGVGHGTQKPSAWAADLICAAVTVRLQMN